MKKPVLRRGNPFAPHTLKLIEMFKSNKALRISDIFLAIKKHNLGINKWWVYQTIFNLKVRGILKKVGHGEYKRESKLPAEYRHLFK